MRSMPPNAPASSPGPVPSAADEPASNLAERRANRILLAVFLSLATAFILSSTYQLVRGVYAAPEATAASDLAGRKSTAACREGLTRLVDALDRSYGAATALQGEAEAVPRFRAGLQPEWDERAGVESACANARGGPEAFATLLRLREGQEKLLRRQGAEIAPLRRSVQAYAR